VGPVRRPGRAGPVSATACWPRRPTSTWARPTASSET
jgi:hypothetical protein